MTEGKLNRRRFLQQLGWTALALPAATVVGKIGESELLASPRDYGGFLVRRLPKGKPNYQIDETRYRRCDQRIVSPLQQARGVAARCHTIPHRCGESHPRQSHAQDGRCFRIRPASRPARILEEKPLHSHKVKLGTVPT